MDEDAGAFMTWNSGTFSSDRIESGGAGVNAGRKPKLATKVQVVRRTREVQRRPTCGTTFVNILVRDGT
jgi:hypothetical protein